MPVDSKPAEDRASQSHQREFHLCNFSHLCAFPDANSRDDGKHTQQDGESGDNIHQIEVFIPRRCRRHQIVARHRKEDEYSRQQHNPDPRSGTGNPGQPLRSGLRGGSWALPQKESFAKANERGKHHEREHYQTGSDRAQQEFAVLIPWHPLPLRTWEIVCNSNDFSLFIANSKQSPLAIHFLPQIFVDRFPLDRMSAQIFYALNTQNSILIDGYVPLLEQVSKFEPRAVCSPRALIRSRHCIELVAGKSCEDLPLLAGKIAIRKHLDDLRPRLISRSSRVIGDEQDQFLRRFYEEEAVKCNQIAFVADPAQIITPYLIKAHADG